MPLASRAALWLLSAFALLGCEPAREASGSLSLPLPSLNGELATFTSHGVAVADGDGDVGLRLAAWGRPGALASAEETEPARGGRLEYRRAGLTEWWVDLADGLEQGFDVPSPPAGDGPLVFDLVVTGATVTVAGDVATLRRPSGRRPEPSPHPISTTRA